MTRPTFAISEAALGGTDIRREFQLLKDHGFTHVTLGYKWNTPDKMTEAEIAMYQQAMDATGVKIQDVHGQHPHYWGLASENAEQRQLSFDLFQHRLHVTHALGGDAMVYHVPTRALTDGVLGIYIDGLERLEDQARELGIVVALENHYIAETDKETFTRCFEKFDPEYIGFTFDSGHAKKSGNTDWLVRNCMDRLAVLHLNDNDGKGDLHWIPFKGVVDWEVVAQAISKSPYKKPLQFEIGWKGNQHWAQGGELSQEEFLQMTAESAQQVQTLVEKYRS